MISRRKFSKLFGFSFLAGSYSSCAVHSKSLTQTQGNLIISTWNNQAANNLAINELSASSSNLLAAVESGIRSVESDAKDQSVGYGGRPDREGKVTLDACIMDKNGNAGSVTYLESIKHPISVARKVMEETPHVMLSGAGAQQFALDIGFKKENLLTDKSSDEYKEWLKEKKYKPKANIELHDTIGLLAKNAHGDLSGGCSTSGMAYKMSGRVGDSPIIGAGLFVDNEVGACTATGVGELVMQTCASFLCVELMRTMKPQRACEAAINRIIKKCKTTDMQVGLIAVNKKGEVGAYSILPGFVYTVTQQNSTVLKNANSYIK